MRRYRGKDGLLSSHSSCSCFRGSGSTCRALCVSPRHVAVLTPLFMVIYYRLTAGTQIGGMLSLRASRLGPSYPLPISPARSASRVVFADATGLTPLLRKILLMLRSGTGKASVVCRSFVCSDDVLVLWFCGDLLGSRPCVTCYSWCVCR